MANNPIKMMTDEHEIISSLENVVKALDGFWKIDAEIYKSIVNEMIAFFRQYSDGYHHQKEENIFFPAINSHPDFTLHEIIDELNQHHEDFREYTREIVSALEENDFEKSYLELASYFDNLLDHIAVENDELFVMAENFLDDDDAEIMYFKFMDSDMELGESRKRELESLPRKWVAILKVN